MQEIMYLEDRVIKERKQFRKYLGYSSGEDYPREIVSRKKGNPGERINWEK